MVFWRARGDFFSSGTIKYFHLIIEVILFFENMKHFFGERSGFISGTGDDKKFIFAGHVYWSLDEVRFLSVMVLECDGWNGYVLEKGFLGLSFLIKTLI